MLCVDEDVDTAVAWVNVVGVGLGTLFLNAGGMSRGCKLGYALKVACVPPSLSRHYGPASLNIEKPSAKQKKRGYQHARSMCVLLTTANATAVGLVVRFLICDGYESSSVTVGKRGVPRPRFSRNSYGQRGKETQLA